MPSDRLSFPQEGSLRDWSPSLHQKDCVKSLEKIILQSMEEQPLTPSVLVQFWRRCRGTRPVNKGCKLDGLEVCFKNSDAIKMLKLKVKSIKAIKANNTLATLGSKRHCLPYLTDTENPALFGQFQFVNHELGGEVHLTSYLTIWTNWAPISASVATRLPSPAFPPMLSFTWTWAWCSQAASNTTTPGPMGWCSLHPTKGGCTVNKQPL